MTALFTMVLLLAQAGSASLDQIRAENNLEHRAKIAIEYAATAERNAENAYSRNDMPSVSSELKNMVAALEIAREALDKTRKSPVRHPGPFKFGEIHTKEILVRLGDFERRVDAEERAAVERSKEKVQEIHDVWFEGIMSKKK